MNRVIWTALAAIVSTAAATLALRGLAYAWRRIRHEAPPEQPRWARWLVAMPLKKGVTKGVEAATPAAG